MIDDNKHQDDNDSLHLTFVALAKLLHEFNINHDIFCKRLRQHYVKTVHQSSQTVVRTALRASIDRRIVADIVKNKKQHYKPSFLLTIINRIETIAKSNNMLVDKKGINSIESIMHETAPGATTLLSVITELLALGCIEDEGTKIRFIGNTIRNSISQQKALRDFSYQLEDSVNEMLDGNNNEP